MKRVVFFGAAVSISISAALAGPFTGRWAMHVPESAERRVFWLEVMEASDGQLSGTFFGATGGRMARLLDPMIRGPELSFGVERVFDGSPPRHVRAFTTARIRGAGLEGVTRIGDREYAWIGWRSPEIPDSDDGNWREGKPVKLLDRGLSRWNTLRPGRKSEWVFRDEVLRNTTPKADLLVTNEKFWNFKLHVEYRIPAGGNSGVGLRNHYEVQIFDDHGQPPDIHGNGSVYSRLRPSVNASKPPGEWQSLDITLIGRQVTIVLNGVTTIDRQTIAGLCGLALDPHENRPGPVSLQGDHGPVEFRNVIVIPLAR